MFKSIAVRKDGIENWTGLKERGRQTLRLDADFNNLRKIDANVAWFVKLTDANLLDLVSTSPQLEETSIDPNWAGLE